MNGKVESLRKSAKKAGVVWEYPETMSAPRTKEGLVRQRQFVGRTSVKTKEIIEHHTDDIVKSLNKGETVSDLSKRYSLARPTMHGVLRKIGKWVFVKHENL